jgi:hypothetical protein
LLQRLIQDLGQKKWTLICSEFCEKSGLNRSAKQCRDRWFNVLKIKERKKMSQNDVAEILTHFEKLGPQWSKLSVLLPNFTENELKNFINATLRRNLRRLNKNKAEEKKISGNIRLLKIPELRKILLSDKAQKQCWFDSVEISSETLGFINKIESYKCSDIEFNLGPIWENNINFPSPTIYFFEETDLPCEDLFS